MREENGISTVIVEDVDFESHYVLLKVEGDFMYRLLLSSADDFTSGMVYKSPISPPVSSSSEIPNGTRITKEHNGSTIEANYFFNFRMNRQNPFCDSIETTRYTNAVVVGTPNRNLPDAETIDSYSCGRVLSTEELKGIDLTNITFCDGTIESEDETGEDKCQYGQNLEFLTNDL